MTNYLVPKTMEEGIKFAEYISSSGMVPPNYKNKPKDILCAIGYGMEIGLKPFQALQSIAVINGKPSLWGDALIALAIGHPECKDFKEWIDGEGEEAVAHCEITRSGRSSVISKTFSVEDAQKAGLWNKSGPWKSYPKVMLQQRATTFAIRRAFPDALKGFTSTEELHDIPGNKPLIDEDTTKPLLEEAVEEEASQEEQASVFLTEEERGVFVGWVKAHGIDGAKAGQLLGDLGIASSHKIPVAQLDEVKTFFEKEVERLKNKEKAEMEGAAI